MELTLCFILSLFIFAADAVLPYPDQGNCTTFIIFCHLFLCMFVADIKGSILIKTFHTQSVIPYLTLKPSLSVPRMT